MGVLFDRPVRSAVASSTRRQRSKNSDPYLPHLAGPVSSRRATVQGGVVYATAGHLDFRNCSFTNNTAFSQGGYAQGGAISFMSTFWTDTLKLVGCR